MKTFYTPILCCSVLTKNKIKMKIVFKKINILILVLFSFSSLITGQINYNEGINKQIEKGSIKSLVELSYFIYKKEKYGEIKYEKSTVHKFSRSFDKRGRMISQTIYSDDGGVKYKNIFTFNDNENSRESIRYNSEGIIDQRWKTFLDEKGNSIKEYDIGINNYEMDIINGAVNKFTNIIINYEYNDKGQLKTRISHNEDGSVRSKTKNKYYENGILKLNHEIYFGSELTDLAYSNASKRFYNIRGEEIKKNDYDSDGELESQEKFKYHPNGNLSKLEHYYSNGTLFYEKSYDVMGDEIIQKTYDSYGQFLGKCTHNFSFKRDNQENWVKKTKISKCSSGYGTGTEVKERIIEYY